VGIYLVDVSPDSWAQDDAIRSLLDQALAERGLEPYPGPPGGVPAVDSFEEKVSPPMGGFSELCDRHGAADVLEAALFVPVAFDGLITLPAGNAYDDERTVVLSSQRLRDLIAPMAAEVGLPEELPRGTLALSNAIADPVTFYVAVYRQAAEHSLRYHCPLAYI
jgi:hypothetical protein